jgi:hypothetical protein
MKTALKITTAVALVMGGLLTGACGGPLTDTKPSAFIEQLNQTTKDVFEDPTGLQFKKYSPVPKPATAKKVRASILGSMVPWS